MNIDKEAFEYAIQKIDDGFIFENFAVSFLSSTLGYEFIPPAGASVSLVKPNKIDNVSKFVMPLLFNVKSLKINK